MVILDDHVPTDVVYVGMARGAYSCKGTLIIRDISCEKHLVSCDIHMVDSVGPGFA